MGGKFC